MLVLLRDKGGDAADTFEQRFVVRVTLGPAGHLRVQPLSVHWIVVFLTFTCMWLRCSMN